MQSDEAYKTFSCSSKINSRRIGFFRYGQKIDLFPLVRIVSCLVFLASEVRRYCFYYYFYIRTYIHRHVPTSILHLYYTNNLFSCSIASKRIRRELRAEKRRRRRRRFPDSSLSLSLSFSPVTYVFALPSPLHRLAHCCSVSFSSSFFSFF